MTELQQAAKCALADLLGILPEYESSGDRGHPGWKTAVELYDALAADRVDVSDYATAIAGIRTAEENSLAEAGDQILVAVLNNPGAAGTSAEDWRYIDGPATGVGVEFWLQNEKAGLEAYVCDDQGEIGVEVQPIAAAASGVYADLGPSSPAEGYRKEPGQYLPDEGECWAVYKQSDDDDEPSEELIAIVSTEPLADRLIAALQEDGLLAAVQAARQALRELSEHPAFADDAPEFNRGGVGYEACRILDRALEAFPSPNLRAGQPRAEQEEGT